ncbi:MAG TPA: SMC-Scp complex subunit ScpB [Candidatus Methylacidiphilales bacterium]|nr:SMC-Scp complex subunit ScpB [Candidatus Methylacidiphilales bacterium]
MDLYRIVESLLFATDRPLTPKAISHTVREAAKFSPAPETAAHDQAGESEVEAAIEELRRKLEESESSLMVQGIAGGYQLKTRPEFAIWTNKLFDQAKAPRLSQPALETLAVIAYRQPLGRAEIESVRGVAVDGVLATLLERKVIRIAGRSEQPGRPLLYETTPLFLELFGLKSLDELPNAGELRRLQPPESSHAPEQQQLEVGLDPADAVPASPGGSDRPQDPEASPAKD